MEKRPSRKYCSFLVKDCKSPVLELAGYELLSASDDEEEKRRQEIAMMMMQAKGSE
jgi:hypothetical protein